MVWVSWFDVVKWCNAKSEEEGLTPCYYTDTAQTIVYRTGSGIDPTVKWAANGYRLPTEAEWEKAARGGLVGQRFPWGNTINTSQANYYSEPGTYTYDLGPTTGGNPTYNDDVRPWTSPVGVFPTNGYGLYDMAGNVSEWCWDYYALDYSSSLGRDPRGPASSSWGRVFRGGAWCFSAYGSRCSCRDYFNAASSYEGIGFRLALAATIATADSPSITVDTRSNVTAYFTSATTILVTAAGYTATGKTVDISLGFAPATGTNLTVVNNTGLDFITGRFANLAQGQAVDLVYGTTTYQFVANYYGGTGNDLVLQWANTKTYAWGSNQYGQLGNASNTDSPVPVTEDLSGKTVMSVVAGESHSLALCSDGTVASWGWNWAGQLGNGSTTDSNVPVAVDTTGVLSGKTAVAVAAGSYHSLALCSDGTVAAWGYNYFGQLGNGTTTDSSVPVAVDTTGVLSGKTVVAVAAGNSHSLALCSDGTVAAWGYNHHGQLGNGSSTDSNVPVAVDTTGVLSGKTVVAVAAGVEHSVALCSDGTLAAWGSNYFGELGIGSPDYDLHSVPVAVDTTGVLSGRTVVAVAAGSYHSLALCSDGTVAAWGYNYFGQLGNDTTSSSGVPVAVDTAGVLSGKTVAAVTAGYLHSMALCADGTVATWGRNNYGQLGNNSTTDSSVPVAVSMSSIGSGGEFVALASGCGANHSLAITALPLSGNSDLSSLTLGAGTLSPEFATSITSYTAGVANAVTSVTVTPTVADPTATVKVNGAEVASGTTSADTSLSVGTNTITVLVTAQNGTTTTYTVTVTRSDRVTAHFTSATAVPVTAAGYTTAGNPVDISLGFAPATGTNLTVVNNTGLGFITGQFSNLSQGQLVLLAYNNVTYKFVANYFGGTGNDLVLQWADTQAYAWGYNQYGQLGNHLATNSSSPVTVTATGALLGKTLTAVAAGAMHSLALCSDGTVTAWGFNYLGQLGNGSTINSGDPVAVATTGVLSGKTVVAVAAGTWHSLALCSDGTVAAFGRNSSGQLGNGSTTDSSVPVTVDTTGVLSGKTVVTVAAGYQHSLVLCSDGTLAAWGSNYVGELGIGSSDFNVYSVPVAVDTTGVLSGKTAVAVAAGAAHSVALCSDGTLAAWGSNSYGQLGNNTTIRSSAPTAVTTTGVLSGKVVVGVAAGQGHSMALCSDGTVAAWGDNYYGQLGNNSTNASSVPVAVSTPSVGSGGKFVALAAGCFANHSLAITALPLSGNSDLSSLTLGAGTLSPEFAASTTSYTASVTNAVTSLTVTPTVADPTATVQVNGADVTSGSSSAAIPLSVGTNTITVLVTAQDGTTTSTYTVIVTRAPSAVSTLSGLVPSSGTLSPSFATATTSYTASATNVATSITVMPTVTDATATVTVNGTTVASGTHSAAIPLAVGTNTITVLVTAQDGTTTSTYAITLDNSPYGVWKSGRFAGTSDLSNPALSGDTATPAHDGITNLMKYALTLDPMSCGTGGLPIASPQNGYLTLTYRQNKSATDVTYSAQSADSLDSNSWVPATTVLSQTDEGTYWLVTVRDTVPLAAHPHRFMRLRVTH